MNKILKNVLLFFVQFLLYMIYALIGGKIIEVSNNADFSTGQVWLLLIASVFLFHLITEFSASIFNALGKAIRKLIKPEVA